jgi:homoserine/homoserine lactone efflux protein
VSLQAWLLFCATEAMLCVSPGPAVLLVVSQSLTRGAQAGVAASLGILAANIAYFALSATGVGALLTASTAMFTMIKWAGGAYLVWLGVGMIFGAGSTDARAAVSTSRASTRNAFSLAVLTQGANPKAIIFFVAILPQFLDPAAPVLPQILVLGLTSVVIEFLVLSVYVATCHSARGWLTRPGFTSLLDRAGGACLMAAGARLAVKS